ncbi:MAG TPA: FAD-binding oxidoreductase, partial [Candidatus Latescibacteria bacterium]|nr:FAD-binding oxidoreductase [Candidatus Latescibacterota bacterium]
MYRKVDDRIVSILEDITDGQVVRDEDLMEPYSHDECALSEIWRLPEVVVKP